MMVGVKKLLFFALAVVQVKSRETDYCYAHNDHPYLYLGTRTSYHIYRGGNTSYQTIPNCKPVQIWMLIRHGTRYTDSSESEDFAVLPELRDQIIENHETRNHGRLCDADLRNLKNWRLNPDLTAKTYGQLSKQGIVDMKQLGERIKSNFPELFPPMIKNISSVNYKFRTARRARTRSSMDAVMSGIFDTLPFPDEDIPEVNLFKMNRDCLRWDEEMFQNELTEISDNFRNSTEVLELICNMSSRLGYQFNISFGEIHDMWDMCRHDKAWKVNDLSPWCAVFSEQDLRVLEFREDLYDYHQRGSGHEINGRRGCRMLRDMLQHFEKLENTDYSNEPKGVFNIGRSASLHYFMAAMGLGKETPSLARDFDQTIGRQWHTSLIGTFAANIAAVFYKCSDTKSPNKVMFYLAEQPLRFEGCDEVGFCDWEYVKDKYQEAASNCSPDVCQLTPSSPSTSGVIMRSSPSTSDVIMRASPSTSDVIMRASPSTSDVIVRSSPSTSDVIMRSSPSTSDVIVRSSPSTSNAIVRSSPSTSDAIVRSSPSTSDVIMRSSTSTSDVIVRSSPSTSDVIMRSSPSTSHVIMRSSPSTSDAIMCSSPSTSDVFILILFFFLMLLTVGLSCRRFLRVLCPSLPSIPLYRRFCLRFDYRIPPVHPWRGRYKKMPALQIV